MTFRFKSKNIKVISPLINLTDMKVSKALAVIYFYKNEQLPKIHD